MTAFYRKALLTYLLLLSCLTLYVFAQQTKNLGFGDPNTGYTYRVSANESGIRVYRRVRNVEESIQRINFKGSLVDHDLHCDRVHCYLVVVTSRSRRNVELYSWQRTQFDLIVKKDSFARPHAVKIFSIRGRGFYIAIAQDQLHLPEHNSYPDLEEPKGFIGCAVLKFSRGHEKDIKYHQYIKLPYTPHHVAVFIAHNTDNNSSTLNPIAKPTENYHLVFSVNSNWTDVASSRQSLFIWSPLNEYFWPYRLPRGSQFTPRPGMNNFIVKFPSEPISQNLTRAQDYIPPVESCFHQLQRLLADRDYQARQLIKMGPSIWRFDRNNQLTNISSQVIVHGNVTIRGSLIEMPQISLFGNSPYQSPQVANYRELPAQMSQFSPAAVENKLRQAGIKLNYMREKLSHAILINDFKSTISSQVRFFAPMSADEIIFRGVANSNVQLNGIPFYQLERELVSLNGAQDIGGKVEFGGLVVADVLEIHGRINGRYWLKDAIDVTSNRVQVIDTTGHLPNTALVEFYSLAVPEMILSHPTTINTIPLSDFISRDNRTQIVFGKKTFRHLTTGRLDLAHPGVQLNGFNISRIAIDAIRLRDPRPHQFIGAGGHVTFLKPVRANRLLLRNVINQHINMSSLIQDSVKTSDVGPQLISGHKNFINGLSIARLTTDGSMNGIQINQVFNLNHQPPLSDLGHYMNASSSRPDVPITGRYEFIQPATVHGNLNAPLINGVDMNRRVIRRTPPTPGNLQPQLVRGRKVFLRPLRVRESVNLIDPSEVSRFLSQNITVNYPMVNGIDLRQINAGLARQMQRPPPIYIDNLEIDGNLNLPPKSTLGNYSNCPVDVFRSRLIMAGPEDQFIDVPIRINSLRSRSVNFGPGALNGMSFPSDFVLRQSPRPDIQVVEPIFGHKTFNHISVVSQQIYNGRPVGDTSNRIFIGSNANINQLSPAEMKDLISQERIQNSTGEKVFNTIHVHGNIRAKRINGYYWPDDILLKSASSYITSNLPDNHKRIYSPLVFTNSSSLDIINQLVLRGPIQLHGNMNQVNLTEFARQSATYGDKDLMSSGRPMRNKLFMGGITVKEIRSQGLIDGVNFDEMKRRVVPIGPPGNRVQIGSHKIFLSDTIFSNHVVINYLNDLPMDKYLQSIRFEPDGVTIKIAGKKTVTGALRVSDLVVRGLINGIDFADLESKAISLSAKDQQLRFNKTLTIEGDVYLDNLLIDEKNGTLDGVRLTNLLPIGSIGRSELVLRNPTLSPIGNTGLYGLKVDGSIQDCQITCNLNPPTRTVSQQQPTPLPLGAPRYQPPHQIVTYPPRPIYLNGRNMTLMRTTPPYVMPTLYTQPPPPPVQQPMIPAPLPLISQARGMSMSPKPMDYVPLRKPMSILYEQRLPPKKSWPHHFTPPAISDSLNGLRQQLVSLSLVKHNHLSNLVIGFIESSSNDYANLILPEQDYSMAEYQMKPVSLMILDQIDIPVSGAVSRHLIIGIDTSRSGRNVTSVISSIGGGQPQLLSVLPVESPNSAKFIKVGEATFLLISQDHTMKVGNDPRCPAAPNRDIVKGGAYSYMGSSPDNIDGGIHVYLFHQFKSSSSISAAYFDLFQTIDLPYIDSFEKFSYKGSWYVLATSGMAGKIHLLILRGYSGFQLVSDIDAPMVESVKVYMLPDQRPALIIHQTDGQHRLVESVII